MNLSNEIYAYALENALTHEGKAMPSAVLPKLFQHGLKKEEIGKIMPEINEAIKKVNSLSKENLNSEFEKNKQYLKEKVEQEKGLKDLPNHSKSFKNPNADLVHKQGFYIGNNPEMTDEEIKIIIKILT